MNRHTQGVISKYELPDIEAEFVQLVWSHSRGLTTPSRQELLETLAEQLIERPQAETLKGLVEDVGHPKEVVEAFEASNGIAKLSLFGRWRALPIMWRILHIAVPALTLLAVLVGVRYFTESPDWANGCGGVIATDWEMKEAAGRTEYNVIYRQDERLGIYLCPVAIGEDDVTIERLYKPFLPLYHPLQPVGSELDTERLETTLVGDASNFEPYNPADIPWVEVVLWFEMEHCGFSGTKSFDEVQVDYRYRGRTRTTTLPLGYTVSLSADDQCTDEIRDQQDEENAQFLRAANIRSTDPASPLGLSPEGVSRDLCRYLMGVGPPLDDDGTSRFDQFELLTERAVFTLDDRTTATTLILGAVNGICPEFATQQDDLISLLD